MSQSYKIHINHSVLYLFEGETLPRFSVPSGALNNLRISFLDKSLDVNKLLEQLRSSEQRIYSALLHPDFIYLCDRVFSFFKLIEAAGGLVRNGKNILLIYRRGFWDLPKGKHEKGEGIAETAIREVREECGLKQLQISGPLCIPPFGHNFTFHTYRLKGKNILKRTWWFAMTTAETELVPQSTEDIEQAIWINPKDMASYQYLAYDSIKEVLSA